MQFSIKYYWSLNQFVSLANLKYWWQPTTVENQPEYFLKYPFILTALIVGKVDAIACQYPTNIFSNGLGGFQTKEFKVVNFSGTINCLAFASKKWPQTEQRAILPYFPMTLKKAILARWVYETSWSDPISHWFSLWSFLPRFPGIAHNFYHSPSLKGQFIVAN